MEEEPRQLVFKGFPQRNFSVTFKTDMEQMQKLIEENITEFPMPEGVGTKGNFIHGERNDGDIYVSGNG